MRFWEEEGMLYVIFLSLQNIHLKYLVELEHKIVVCECRAKRVSIRILPFRNVIFNILFVR